MQRRDFIQKSIATIGAASIPSISSSQTTFNPAAAITELKVNYGLYSGAYMIAPLGYINWYFANVGLYPFVGIIPNVDIQAYLEAYIKVVADINKKHNLYRYTVADIYLNDPEFDPSNAYYGKPKYLTSSLASSYKYSTEKYSDSDDAYAGTFASLAVKFLRAMQVAEGKTYYQTPSWALQTNPNTLLTNLDTIKKIVYWNILMSSKSVATATDYGMLSNTFQNVAYNQQSAASSYITKSYLFDNCEAYRGVIDLAKFLSDIVDPDRATFATAAYRLQVGVDYLYYTGAPLQGFRPADDESVTLSSFYKCCALQVGPQAYGVLDSTPTTISNASQKYTQAWNLANSYVWSSCSIVEQGSSTFPWMVIGYVAARRGQTASAITQMTNVASLFTSNRGKVTINELGWYQRTKVLTGQ